jgi:hypothetical protein
VERWRTRAFSCALAAAGAALLGGPTPGALAHSAPQHRTPTVAVRDRSTATALRRGGFTLIVTGTARRSTRIALTLVERHRGRRAGATRVGTLSVTPAAGGRARLPVSLDAAARDRVRLALARCDRLTLVARVTQSGHTIRRTAGLAVPRCPTLRTQLRALIRTPGGDYPGSGSRPAVGRPARFEVGAAVADFSPPPAGRAPGDGSSCLGAAAFTGSRAFAFTEPYTDLQHAGQFSPGDPFLDCNANGRWDGNLLGGGAANPRYYTRVADPVTARALVVRSGRRTLAVEVVDQEGLFNVYQDEIRRRVAAAGIHLGGIFISATHDESAPDSLGLGGVTPLTSGVNDDWLKYFIARSAQAIIDADRAMRPAAIRYTETLEPREMRQCWSSYPFVDDQHIPILQAVDARGRTIATLASVSQHAETLGFNGGTPELDAERDWVSADWVNFFRHRVEQQLGGVAIEMAGSVGSVESPEVYTGPIARTPQQELDASHPAGCRTEFMTPAGADTTGADHVALGYRGETEAFGDQIAGSVVSALRSRQVYPSRSATLWGATANVCVPLSNLLFQAASAGGVFAHRPGYSTDCSHAFPLAPNGTTAGTSLLSQVASFRIGDGQFLAVPGEAFPFTYLGSFLGPQDMPDPSQPMTPMLIPHLHARFRFFDGLAEDMIGYIFPAGNAVGIPTASNPSAINSDTDRFGCNHSDDAESTGAGAGQLLGGALVKLLDAHGGRPEQTEQGRYVLPDGTVSRDPLGGPESLRCNADQSFHPDGPAVGVELPGGRVVHPLAWMSLSGLPQTRPDRDTRGYLDARGRRVWLNVFPDVTLP